ncbi:MAG: iron transporter [Alphaproteobacteria bacterium]|jgi:hypothetical protein|nr:iron transporter [Alphaproteobacteria bacterium]MDP6517159.1 iron transporter [Alphaproteobacteria bacterium]
MNILTTRVIRVCATALGIAIAVPALSAEQPAGEPMEKNGLEIKGVFLQAVMMEPAMTGQEAEATDIHLEADIVALPDNDNGFVAGAWVPYLDIDYRLTSQSGDWSHAGSLHAMVASDGPHYGANVKLDGPGEYTVTFHIRPPSVHGLMRHIDKETGVGPWWEPFTYEGSFIFVGAGKKADY